MTDRFSAKARSPRNVASLLIWKNMSGETIPAYGCIKLNAYHATGDYYDAVKPDGEGSLHFTNGAAQVESGNYGGSHLWDKSQLCLTPSTTFGATVGPVSGSWEMEESGSGFAVFSDPVSGMAAILKEGGGGTVNLQYGIINEIQPRGYYTVELAEWAGTTPVADEVPDICDQTNGSTSGSGDDTCSDIVLPLFESQLVGTGVYVLAYDPESVLVTLEIGSDCVFADMGATNATGSASGSSASSGATEPVFQIVRGYQTHTTVYKERWTCCNGVDTLVGRTAITFAAKVCDEAICDPCGA